MKSKKHPAVFLDRDGTLIEDRGYIDDEHEIVFFENTFDALGILQENYLLFIITNQSGIGKGILSKDKVYNVNKYLVNCFKAKGITIFDTYCCPHVTEDFCWCKKPEPYFLYKAEQDYNIDLSISYMIGDHPEDVYCAENAGATGIYVLTGHGLKHLHEFDEKPIIQADILEAAMYINSKQI